MVMAIIFLLFAGLTMFVVPVSYIPVLGKALGFYLLVQVNQWIYSVHIMVCSHQLLMEV